MCPAGPPRDSKLEQFRRRDPGAGKAGAPLQSLLWPPQRRAPVRWLTGTCGGAGAGGQPLPLYHLLQGCSGGGDSLLRAGTGSQHAALQCTQPSCGTGAG